VGLKLDFSKNDRETRKTQCFKKGLMAKLFTIAIAITITRTPRSLLSGLLSPRRHRVLLHEYLQMRV
jgi:hypothetical protein